MLRRRQRELKLARPGAAGAARGGRARAAVRDGAFACVTSAFLLRTWPTSRRASPRCEPTSPRGPALARRRGRRPAGVHVLAAVRRALRDRLSLAQLMEKVGLRGLLPAFRSGDDQLHAGVV